MRCVTDMLRLAQTGIHTHTNTDTHRHTLRQSHRQSGLRTMQLAWTLENNEFNMATSKREMRNWAPNVGHIALAIDFTTGRGKWAGQESNNSLQHMFTGVSLQCTHIHKNIHIHTHTHKRLSIAELVWGGILRGETLSLPTKLIYAARQLFELLRKV